MTTVADEPRSAGAKGVLRGSARTSRIAARAVPAVLVGAFVAVGAVGAYRYVGNFWLYRGFAPPHDPAFVHQRGTVETIDVASPAVGRTQPVLVFLPPGYAQRPSRRYPVLYLLHGSPGRPAAFLSTVRVGVVEDVLVAQRRMQPLILVMPFGSTGTFTDEEWANGVGAHSQWETFVARDVVRAIDTRYRTIASGVGRAIAGLSEGGYGALNIALHHPGEFHVVESWSGYERAVNRRSIFAGNPRLLAYNSPASELPLAAARLRRGHSFVWLYAGADDRLLGENRAFVRELSTFRIAHRFRVVGGGHTWAAWRGNATAALLAAGRRLDDAV